MRLTCRMRGNALCLPFTCKDILVASSATEVLHFDLDLSPAANSVITRIAQRRNIKPEQVLARAIALLAIEEDAEEAGQSLGVIDKNKNLVGEVS